MAPSWAADQPQWGQQFSRNMVSAETGLPDRFDSKSGENVLWSVPLGTQTYGSPTVAGGRVFIGTNNDVPRDPRHQGDRGILLCLNESDGSLVWQLVVPKLEKDIYLDWPQAGFCSPPTIEGNRVYTVTNRDEVVCLDLAGMANGNDGPYRDEARHLTPRDESPLEVGPTDADILWLLDLRQAVGVRPHDTCHSAILLDGPYLYLNSNNGLDSKHETIEKPDAPSFVVVDKRTGKLVAQERLGISRNVFHNSWAAPSLGDIAGRRLVFFGAGDGTCYAFEAFKPAATSDAQRDLELVWRFDSDTTVPKENVHQYIGNRHEGPSDIKGMPVLCDGRLYLTAGGDIWWGKRRSALVCLDPSGSGDLTQSGRLWSYPMESFCCSTPAVADGLVYVADCSGKLHCVDAQTGKACWVHNVGGEIWASPLVADGRVYIGTRRGNFAVLAAGRQKQLLSAIRLEDPITATAVAANGRLYVATMTRLYALGK